MARLTERQWEYIRRRLLTGEKIPALAKEFGITRQAITKKLGSLVTNIKAVAIQIVETEQNLRKLPESCQVSAVNLASELMSISNHLASGAKYGAMTFHRLAGIANQHAETLDDSNPSMETLVNIGALTKVGNESAATGLNLLNANKETIKKLNTQDNNQSIATMTDAELERIIAGA